jgi:hypothetical protein
MCKGYRVKKLLKSVVSQNTNKYSLRYVTMACILDPTSIQGTRNLSNALTKGSAGVFCMHNATFLQIALSLIIVQDSTFTIFYVCMAHVILAHPILLHTIFSIS